MIDVEILRAAGLTEAQIVKVLELYHKEYNARVREQTRIRVQKHRARNDVTRYVRYIRDTNVDSIEESPPPEVGPAIGTEVAISSLTSKDTFKKESKKESKKEIARTFGKACPWDFKPSERDYEIGSKYGLSRQQVEIEATSMLEWSQANRHRPVARKVDWHLTLHGFLRRAGRAPAPSPMTPEEYHRKYTRGNNGQGTKTASTDGSRIASSNHEEELFSARPALHSDRASKR